MIGLMGAMEKMAPLMSGICRHEALHANRMSVAKVGSSNSLKSVSQNQLAGCDSDYILISTKSCSSMFSSVLGISMSFLSSACRYASVALALVNERDNSARMQDL